MPCSCWMSQILVLNVCVSGNRVGFMALSWASAKAAVRDPGSTGKRLAVVAMVENS